jgi:hypothetical protein
VVYDGAFAGLLNYACTHLALKMVRLQFRAMRYWLIALLTGTFKKGPYGMEEVQRKLTRFLFYQSQRQGKLWPCLFISE